MQVVARALPLRPVPHVVQADHAQRPRHAHQGAEQDQHALNPPRCRQAAVDQQPVQPDGVPGA